MPAFWSLTGSNGRPYTLCLSNDGQWYIVDDETKETVIRYLEPVHKWYGKYKGKTIILDWPTFRDMIEQMILKMKMIEIKNDNGDSGKVHMYNTET